MELRFRRFARLAERDEEASQLASHLTEVLGARAADGGKAGAVVQPEHGRRGMAEQPELRPPKGAAESILGAVRIGKAFAMEGDMAGFVPQDELAHFGEGNIG